jgi:hypothetical protein
MMIIRIKKIILIGIMIKVIRIIMTTGMLVIRIRRIMMVGLG